MHKRPANRHAQPEYRIVEQGGLFKVYDRNEHYRCSFATLAAAQAYVDVRTGKHTVLEPAPGINS